MNVYHCCEQKTASQWIKAILSHPRIYRYSGLLSYQYERQLPGSYDPRPLTRRFFCEAFPPRTIAGPLYVDFRSYATIPKPDRYRTFFVVRDPRDMVVSNYFSAVYSHGLAGPISDLRKVLVDLPVADGLLLLIRRMHDHGRFEAMRSWADAAAREPHVLLIRFEDLTGADSLGTWRLLLDHCDIGIPTRGLSALLDDYSFERLSGRRRGDEDRSSHYRKGVAGDWRAHFDPRVESSFRDTTQDLATYLGY